MKSQEKKNVIPIIKWHFYRKQFGKYGDKIIQYRFNALYTPYRTIERVGTPYFFESLKFSICIGLKSQNFYHAYCVILYTVVNGSSRTDSFGNKTRSCIGRDWGRYIHIYNMYYLVNSVVAAVKVGIVTTLDGGSNFEQEITIHRIGH